MSLGTILLIILIIFLLGGFSGRFGGYGYGYRHRRVGLIGTIVILLLILGLLGHIWVTPETLTESRGCARACFRAGRAMRRAACERGHSNGDEAGIRPASLYPVANPSPASSGGASSTKFCLLLRTKHGGDN